MTKYQLYSVGHSNQSQEDFLELLKIHDINCIVDVRSVPASKYTPQFNMESLKWFLKSQGIQYLHFGDEFGARRTDCLDADDQVNFELAVETPNFKHGVERLMKGLEKDFRISLMCSEANPLEGAELASHKSLEEEMIAEFIRSRKYHVPEVDELFGSYTSENQRRDAYRQKNKEIGFRLMSSEEEE